MAIPASPVEICNLALDKVGQDAISSLSGNDLTPTEALMARNYDPVRQELLREYVFNFSVRTVSLTRVGDAPGTRYADAYAVPNGHIRTCVVGPDTPDSRILDYAIQDMANGSKIILCDNGGAASLEYTACWDITDVNKWDSQFRKCMIISLALAVCYAITKSNTAWKRLSEELNAALPSAVSVDGQEQPPERIEVSRFLSARQTLMGSNDGVASRYTDLRNI